MLKIVDSMTPDTWAQWVKTKDLLNQFEELAMKADSEGEYIRVIRDGAKAIKELLNFTSILIQERDTLKGRLDKYGGHTLECQWDGFDDRPCNCGFTTP